jgi:dipeptidyl aminopeptidase/acylaminoacyl peptidase
MIWRSLALVCVTVWASTPVAGAQASPVATVVPSVPDDVRGLIEWIVSIPEVDQVELSPDGRRVIYALRERDVGANLVRTSWWLSGDSGGSQRLDLGSATQIVRWLPDSREFIAMLTQDNGVILRRMRIEGEGTAVLRDYSLGRRSIVSAAVSNDGRHVAFVTPREAQDGVALPTWPQDYESWQRNQAPFLLLRLLDLGSGALSSLGPPDVSLSPYSDLAWSPDDRTIAGTIDHRPNSQGKDTDIALFDVASGTMRAVTNMAGMDANPSWSPDGSAIAFVSQFGVPEYYSGWPAVLHIDDGSITSFPRETGLRSSTTPIWQADGRGFYYAAPAQMHSELVRLRLSGPSSGACARVPLDDHYIALRSFSRDRRRMAFIASTPVSPPQIYVADLDEHGCGIGTPRLVWAQQHEASLLGRIQSREVAWESPDRRFQIHATLLMPIQRSGPPGPLPGALYLEGGPSMVTADFGDYVFDRVRLILALRGFAVLTPNTRGRPGYGTDFLNGIRDYGRIRVPLSDAEAGMDWLINQGIVDAHRQAVVGFSYGGLLSAAAVAHSRRFRAAVVHEGASDMWRFVYPPEPGTYDVLAVRDLGGLTDPFAPSQRQQIFEQSPGFHMEHAGTPTLLLYGAHNLAADDGSHLWAALRHYDVPVRYLVYDEGHGFVAPSSLVSAMDETVNWIEQYLNAVHVSSSDSGVEEFQRPNASRPNQAPISARAR